MYDSRPPRCALKIAVVSEWRRRNFFKYRNFHPATVKSYTQQHCLWQAPISKICYAVHNSFDQCPTGMDTGLVQECYRRLLRRRLVGGSQPQVTTFVWHLHISFMPSQTGQSGVTSERTRSWATGPRTWSESRWTIVQSPNAKLSTFGDLTTSW